MKTIQMTLEETLLNQIDQVVKELQVTRSVFIQQAVKRALQTYAIRHLEAQDEAGYQAIPAVSFDSAEWQSEQVWGDEWNVAK